MEEKASGLRCDESHTFPDNDTSEGHLRDIGTNSSTPSDVSKIL